MCCEKASILELIINQISRTLHCTNYPLQTFSTPVCCYRSRLQIETTDRAVNVYYQYTHFAINASNYIACYSSRYLNTPNSTFSGNRNSVSDRVQQQISGRGSHRITRNQRLRKLLMKLCANSQTCATGCAILQFCSPMLLYIT